MKAERLFPCLRSCVVPHRRRDAASSLPLELNSKRMVDFIVCQSLHHALPLIRLCCLSGQPTRISYG